MRTVIWFVYFWLYLLAAIPVSGYIWWLEKRTVYADELVRSCPALGAASAALAGQGRGHRTGQPTRQPAVYVANHQGNFDIPSC
ncbi:MAG: hypothetical protein ACLUB2_02795 [Butyricicoccus pullicaecorum]